MGSHMLYVIGAGVIFFTSVITINRTVLNNFNTISESNILLTSASIGQSIIEEAQGKLFDESLDGESAPDIPACFTADGLLGEDNSETYPAYNDIDDFNGLVKLSNTPAGICSTVVKVGYVDSTDVNQWISSRGFFKKMEVAVYTNSLPQPVKLEYLFCYNK